MEYWHSLGSLKTANIAEKIKNPKDFVVLSLKILEMINTWGVSESAFSVTIPYLYVDPDVQKRAFIVKGNQIVSFAFPFAVYTKTDPIIGEHVMINYRDMVIDDVLVSRAMTIANSLDMEKTTYAAQVQGMDFRDTIKVAAHKIFELVLSLEPSYIRYDFDKPASRGTLHPMYHFDVNYNKANSYKIGLYGDVQLNSFKELLSKNNDSWYVNPYSKLLNITVSIKKSLRKMK